MKKHLNRLQIGVLLLHGFVFLSPAAATNPRFIGAASIDTMCKGDNCPTMKDKLAAEAKARNWLEELPQTGFSLQSGNASAAYDSRPMKWVDAGGADIVAIHAYGGEWPTSLYFKGPINSSMSVKELQSRVHTFTQSGFPTPGLAVDNWRIMAMPQSTHLRKDIQILEVAPGHLKFRVRTQFLSLYGLDKRLPDWQDVATPPEAYFSITRPFAGEAVITYKVENF